MLQSAAINSFFQCMTDSQSSSQIVSDEEEFDKEDLKKKFV
jgi:hypothetical protein